MSRRHVPTIKVDKNDKNQSRSMIKSLEIPDTYSSRRQSRTNNVTRKSDGESCCQKGSPKSETLSIACSYQELFCTTDSCTNSQNCMKTFPEVCPHGLKTDNEEGHCSNICHEIHNATNKRESTPSKGCVNSTSSVRITTIRDSPSSAGLSSSYFESKRSRTLVKCQSCSQTQNAKKEQPKRNSVEFAPVTQSRRTQISSNHIHDPKEQVGNDQESINHTSCCQEVGSPSQGSTGSHSYFPEKCYKDTGSQTDERITLYPICRPKTEPSPSEQNQRNSSSPELADKNMTCCVESDALIQTRQQEDTEQFEKGFVDTGTHVTPVTKTAGTGTSKSTKKSSSKSKGLDKESTESSPRSLSKEECMDCCAKLESTRSRPNLQSSVRISEPNPETTVTDSCCAKVEDICKVGADTKNYPISCVGAELDSPVQKKCSCHFPPAFKQFACTGNIAGNCNCASSD